MLTKRNSLLIGIVILVVTLATFYMSFTTKTSNETEYKLTVYAKHWIDKTPIKFFPIEVIQKVNSEEKKIATKKTDGNGVVVFYLPPGKYKCRVPDDLREKGFFEEFSLEFIDLKGDKEVELKIQVMPTAL